MSLTYWLLVVCLAPVPLYIWLPYLSSYTTSLLVSLMLNLLCTGLPSLPTISREP